MPSIRCVECVGSGQVMGGGMVIKKCYSCRGEGWIEQPKDEMEFLVAKQTESYKAAKKRLRDKHKHLDDDEAEKLLDEALKKESKDA